MVKDNQHNVFYLASFPRSGNTWVRFLIANVYNLLDKKYDEVDFFTVHEIVPELFRNVQPSYACFPYVYKTHDTYREDFRHVILLLRNPWDAIYSYYHYLTGENKKQVSVSEVVHHPQYGMTALSLHTDSYTGHCRNLLVLSYEDFWSDTLRELRKIMVFIKLEVQDDVLFEAIGKSSFSNMRQLEITKGRKYGGKDFLFTRKGLPGDGYLFFKENHPELFSYIQNVVVSNPMLHKYYIESE